MEIAESRPNTCYYRPCGSLCKSQFAITCKFLILKGIISWGLSINIMDKMPQLNI